MTRAESCDENAEWYPYFLIKPDPRCSECVTIMDWRSAHREFIITNGTEIKLSDYGWGSLSAHLGTVSRPPSFCTLGAEDLQPLEFGDEFA